MTEKAYTVYLYTTHIMTVYGPEGMTAEQIEEVAEQDYVYGATGIVEDHSFEVDLALTEDGR